ncbi:MAG: hypothetical protein COZ49_00360 [Candidatus Yonathbacteria bacterium CG_4_10_14_3_um_filter_47_65]|uniref:Uncharacterized protein n=2 Tax=Parcubacteria group TaxID=1794811 RepID=A0A2M8D7I7_9BACT|nr:MAG: hypothetical protein AUJ44_01970 [Candidatus Nomurabacteria bacterium CG1_02_47_685]PIP04172.1 MAG: hypothetical protein COX54_00545 [Candidatus Yonathbacteria bacterium CG23_combo_of_CG06-09_8_20_14_all_46_18]PIQ31836.1 MAG: hypothetical protein COW61_03040 [Candidatus Yonathbacteria bacterium CG17_big_fil_post_rev_8_21_14_2_50_46_19]PIX56781.1 MAG: hypothetical protein COZ49_00360 [Candidatus Yonathbacteria bacterium CG_4_10_14_3_um_filter_47_65]PIY57615.1 MAG: hypothetical protein CO
MVARSTLSLITKHTYHYFPRPWKIVVGSAKVKERVKKVVKENTRKEQWCLLAVFLCGIHARRISIPKKFRRTRPLRYRFVRPYTTMAGDKKKTRVQKTS